MSKKVTYEGINFNAGWAATKSVKEFVEHEKHHGLSKEQLTEAHNLCKTAVKGEVAAADPAPETTN